MTSNGFLDFPKHRRKAKSKPAPAPGSEPIKLESPIPQPVKKIAWATKPKPKGRPSLGKTTPAILDSNRKRYIEQKHETAKSEEETWTTRLKRFAHLFEEFARLADGLEFLLMNGKLQKHTRREKYAVAVKLWRQEIANRYEWVTLAVSPIGERERELRLKGVDAWKEKEDL